MKKLVVTILSLLILISGTSLVKAQDSATTNPVQAEYSVGTQSVWNGKIPVTVKFRTTMNSDYVDVTWDTPYGVDVSSNKTKFLNVVANQTYVYTGYITPSKAGEYSLSFNVIAWQYNTNYTTSSAINLKISNKLLVDPLPANYTAMMVLKYAIFVIGGGLLVFALYIVIKKFSKIFVKWLRPPL